MPESTESTAPEGASLDSLPQANLKDVADAVVDAAPTPTTDSPLEGAPAADGQPVAVDGPRDRWGRAFDPELHLAKADGTPAITRRTGRLIVKKGKQLSAPPAPTTDRGAGRFVDPDAVGGEGPQLDPDLADQDLDTDLDLEDIPGDQGSAAPDSFPGAGADGDKSNLSPEERERVARVEAETITNLTIMVGRFIAGKEGNPQLVDGLNEKDAIHDSLLTYFRTTNKLLPIGPGALALVEVGKYLGRCSTTDTGEKRVSNLRRSLSSTWGRLKVFWWGLWAKKSSS